MRNFGVSLSIFLLAASPFDTTMALLTSGPLVAVNRAT